MWKKLPDFKDWVHGGNNHFNDKLSNKLVIDWSNVAYEAGGGATEPHALLATRSKVMMHIAIHDALNAITPVYEQYAYHASDTWADPFAPTATAAHTVLISLWPNNKEMLDRKLCESLSMVANGTAKTKGID